MAIRFTMTAEVLGRSHFAISPVQEVVYTLRNRNRNAHTAPHARVWYRRARQHLPDDLLAVLEAMVSADHDFIPDFLTPAPATTVDSVDDLTERVASTPEDVVDYHLDIGFRGRTVRPEVAEQHPSTAAYERWRRPMPPVLERLADRGPQHVAETAAQGLRAFYDVAIAEDWPTVRALLAEDIQRRGDLMASRGAGAMLQDLGGGVSWSGSGLSLDRPYDGVVDWADDGLLLVPASTHQGPVSFAAERPFRPILIYRAQGTARLSERSARRADRAMADLIGDTRALLLEQLDAPMTTLALSRTSRLAEATVSYHLKILLRAGLVERTRRGRYVLYRRTRRGSVLLGA